LHATAARGSRTVRRPECSGPPHAGRGKIPWRQGRRQPPISAVFRPSPPAHFRRRPQHLAARVRPGRGACAAAAPSSAHRAASSSAYAARPPPPAEKQRSPQAPRPQRVLGGIQQRACGCALPSSPTAATEQRPPSLLARRRPARRATRGPASSSRSQVRQQQPPSPARLQPPPKKKPAPLLLLPLGRRGLPARCRRPPPAARPCAGPAGPSTGMMWSKPVPGP
jgi:hypothetical protein